MSSFFSARSWRSGGGPRRVFVPHSPLDLKIGHRVRIMLPSGRISTGTLRYLGNIENSPEYHLGVELELADNGQHDGTYEGQRYFYWYDHFSCLQQFRWWENVCIPSWKDQIRISTVKHWSFQQSRYWIFKYFKVIYRLLFKYLILFYQIYHIEPSW